MDTNCSTLWGQKFQKNASGEFEFVDALHMRSNGNSLICTEKSICVSDTKCYTVYSLATDDSYYHSNSLDYISVILNQGMLVKIMGTWSHLFGPTYFCINIIYRNTYPSIHDLLVLTRMP